MSTRLLTLNGLYHSKNDIKDFLRSQYMDGYSSWTHHGRKYPSNKANLDYGHDLAKYIKMIKNQKGVLETEVKYLNTLAQNTNVLYLIEPRMKIVDNLFRSGEWIKIKFASYVDDDYLYSRFLNYQVLHHVHESVHDPLLIAYYPSLDHLRAGKEVRTKIGKYLTQYKDALCLNEIQIKSIVEKHNAEIQARKGWTIHFVDHDDPDGWAKVYLDCTAKSCMSDDDGADLIKQYAHSKSVLNLAYLRSGDSIKARCIVREDKKEYIRVYPEPDGSPEGTFLKSSLLNMGYSHGNLHGVLIKTYYHDDGGYVAPYVDKGNAEYPEGTIRRIDDRLYIEVVASGEFQLTYTDGRTQENDDCECVCCGEYYSEDDMYGDLCRDCDDTMVYASTRNNNSDWINKDDAVYVNNEWYAIEYLSEYDIYCCQMSENYYHIDDLVDTSRGLVHHDEASLLDHEDSEGYSHAVDQDIKELSDGTTCHVDDYEELQEKLNAESEAVNE